MFFVGSDLKKKTGYDLFDIDTSEAVKKIKDIPAYFMVSKEDYITPVSVVNELYNNYGGSVKQFVKLSGFHHTFRTNSELIHASDFLKRLAEKNSLQEEKQSMKLKQNAMSQLKQMSEIDLMIPDEDIFINSPKTSHIFKDIKPMLTPEEEER